MKKVTQNGTVANHERYLYRGYLQIAALDMLDNRNVLRTLLWDPLEPVATRPLALVQDASLYCYGVDFNKNVSEVFDREGAVAAIYDYSPYGAVTGTGSLGQPVQWSGEMHDEEPALAYYNYRFYNPADGRWINRDPIAEQGGWNFYAFVGNSTIWHNNYRGISNAKEKCCCGKKRLPNKSCCKNGEIVNSKSCKIRILMGHYNKENLEKKINQFCKVDRFGIVSCYSTETNTWIPTTQSYPNDGRNPDIINRGGEAARYLRAELEAAKQEAKNMCSKENKRCCSKVIIIVSDSGDKDGKGAWQVKFTFGINPYTVIIDCDKPKPRNCKTRGGMVSSK